MKYYYKVEGYEIIESEKYNQKIGRMVEFTTLAEDEEEAIKLAKKVIKRPKYRVIEASALPDQARLGLELNEKQFELNKEIFALNKEIKEINMQSIKVFEKFAQAIEKFASK